MEGGQVFFLRQVFAAPVQEPFDCVGHQGAFRRKGRGEEALADVAVGEGSRRPCRRDHCGA
jgi:hypothetical protein